jgi:hypothetical protein
LVLLNLAAVALVDDRAVARGMGRRRLTGGWRRTRCGRLRVWLASRRLRREVAARPSGVGCPTHRLVWLVGADLGGARFHRRTSAKRLASGTSSSAASPSRCSSLRTSSRAEGSSLGSLASACAVSQHPAVTGIQAEPAPPGAVPQARVGTPSALCGRLVISWESPGLPRPIPSPGRSSAGTAAMPSSPGSSSPGRTGARPSPVLLVSSSRSQSPSPAWDAMAPCSGRPGLPICICRQPG